MGFSNKKNKNNEKFHHFFLKQIHKQIIHKVFQPLLYYLEWNVNAYKNNIKIHSSSTNLMGKMVFYRGSSPRKNIYLLKNE